MTAQKTKKQTSATSIRHQFHFSDIMRLVANYTPFMSQKKIIHAILLAFACLSTIKTHAGRTPLTLWYENPAQVWMTSALPIGNGDIGAMFFGGVGQEKVQFNDKSLWDGSTTKRGSYHNFGHLHFEFGTTDSCTDYRRELSLDEAVGRVSYKQNGIRHVREYFASNPDSAIIIRLTTPGNRRKLNFSLQMKDGHNQQTTIEGNTLTIKGMLELLCYEARATLLTEGGTIAPDGESLTVRDADAATVILACGTNFDLSSSTYTKGNAGKLHQDITSRLHRAAAKNYDELRDTHVADYRSLFDRVELDFHTRIPPYPTDELVRNHKYSTYLDMLYFQYGRYLMISSARGNGLPSNLQGLWNDVNTPAWECDYHSNINIQMNYWPAEVANLPECHKSFIDYVYTEAMKTHGSWQQVAARDSCRGWAVHTQNNAFGYTDWNINRPANAWYCTHLWQHYAYNLDKNYLRHKAWPVMKLTCEYWFDRLVERNGKLIAPNDWSPEHGPWTDGPAYAQQLVYALFKETLQAATELRIDDNFVKELRKKITLTDNGIHIGPWGQLREWKEHPDEKADHHRHLSHLMALYPGNEISHTANDSLANAAKVSLNARGDGGTGWSRAWKVACWARLGEGARAYHLLKQALNLTNVTVVSMEDNAGGVYENLFCAHPSFQIDGNFGATAGIAEMLIQNTPKGIQLLPALPDAWADGLFRGLRTKGGFTIGLEWSNGHPTTATVHSAKGNRCSLLLTGKKNLKIINGKGKPIKFHINSMNGSVEFNTKKNGEYTIFF